MKKLALTKNEFAEYSKAQASKLWKDKEYTYKDYLNDLKNVDIIPFDLKKYNLAQDLEKAINEIFTTEYINKDNEYTLKGFTETQKEWYEITDRLGLKRVTGYYYSGYCYNDEYNYYMEYCEGDLYLRLFETKEEYKKSLEKTIKWIEENC